MFDASFFIDVFFRIVNVVILIVLLSLLFKKYGLPWAQAKIEVQRQQEQTRQEHMAALVHQLESLQRTVSDELDAGIQIRKKILRWSEAIAADIKMRNREKEQIMRKVAAHVQQKETALLHLQMNTIIIPQALDRTRDALRAEFSDQRIGQHVTARIMQAIRSRSS